MYILGLINETESMNKWNKESWWEINYPDEEVLCGTLSEVFK